MGYYTEGVKLLHRKVFILKKFTPDRKKFTRALPVVPVTNIRYASLFKFVTKANSWFLTLCTLTFFVVSDVPLPEEEKPQNILGTMLRYGSYMALTSGMYRYIKIVLFKSCQINFLAVQTRVCEQLTS